MIDKISERIILLKSECEKSAAQHNALIGALQEAQNMYQLYMTQRDKCCPSESSMEIKNETQEPMQQQDPEVFHPE